MYLDWFFGYFNDAVSTVEAYNVEWVWKWQLIVRKDLKEKDEAYFKILPQHAAGENEENHGSLSQDSQYLLNASLQYYRWGSQLGAWCEVTLSCIYASIKVLWD
jgi:hypothetical protein